MRRKTGPCRVPGKNLNFPLCYPRSDITSTYALFFFFLLPTHRLAWENCIPKSFCLSASPVVNLTPHIIPFHIRVPEGRYYSAQATQSGASPLELNSSAVHPATSLSACGNMYGERAIVQPAYRGTAWREDGCIICEYRNRK